MKNTLLLLFLLVCASSAKAQQPGLALQAYQLRMNGHPYEALQFLDSTLAIYPDSSRLWFERGRTLDWVKVEGCTKFVHVWTKMAPKIRKSGKSLHKACKLDPMNARYHSCYSGVAAIQSLVFIYSPWKWPCAPSKLRSSVNHAEKAMLLDPKNLDYRLDFVTYARLGRIIGGKPKQARIQADSLALMDPYYGLKAKDILNEGKKTRVTIDSYLELMKQYPDHLPLLQEIAQRCMNRDSVKKALAADCFIHILELSPGDRQALAKLLKVVRPADNEKLLTLANAFLSIHEGGYAYNLSVGYTALGVYYKRAGDQVLSDEWVAKAKQVYDVKYEAFLKDQAEP
jgi:hypothetical protein